MSPLIIFHSFFSVTKGCQWCSQRRCSQDQGRTCIMAQLSACAQSSSKHEMQEWSWDGKRHNRPPSLSDWLWLGWWTVNLILPCIFLCVTESLFTVFVMESVRGLSTYPKTIFFDVSTPMEQEILIMSRKDFSEVVYLLRSVLLFSFSPLANISVCSLIDIF